MKPGAYDRASLSEMIQETSYRFGKWEFRAAVGEVWDGRRETVVLLTSVQTYLLQQLIAAWPASVPKSEKMTISRLRAKLGRDLIVSDRRGYRFSPEAVL